MARIPESIDKYKLESLIASGSMGKVYKGIHPTLDRPVILKKLTLRGNTAMIERFRREARILTSFRSDHVVDVYDHFKKGSNHYIVMEYVDGVSVQGLIVRERYFDNAVCAYIALRTAKALAYAHGKQVIHRDIKPDNVLISKRGEVKLADFGIATSREDDGLNLTSEGMTLGTPAYMAPEQFEDSRTVDGRADLYSLGVMLYEMLTGRKPFPGRFSPELVRTIQRGKYTKPRRINPAVASDLQRVVVMLMKSCPRRRCADVGEIIRRLERFLTRYDEAEVLERLVAMVSEAESAPLRPRQRRKITAGWMMAGAAGAALIGTAIGWFCMTGIHQRVFYPADFGQVRFIVEGFPGEVDTDDVRITVSPVDRIDGFDRDIAPQIVPGIARFVGDASSVIVTSFPMALAVGEYCAAVTVGTRQITALFMVRPWKTFPEESKIKIPIVDSGPRTFRVIAEITDAESGEDLTAAAVVEVLRGSAYTSMERAGRLLSGRVFTFRIRAAGYSTKVAVVPVARETGSVTITAEMKTSGGNK